MLSDFGKNYILLALRINEHIEGYVEAYFGLPELNTIVKDEGKTSPKKLLKTYNYLQKELTNQGFQKKRERFLEKILKAMETSIRILNKEKIPFLTQVKRFYDIEPRLIDDSYFYNGAEKLMKAYQGVGSLFEKLEIIRKRRVIPEENIISVYSHALNMVAERTRTLYPNLLPKDEEISLNIVNNKAWRAKNRYLGNFKSIIDINIDRPHFWTTLFRLAAHEGYPGHHTEFTLKDLILYQQEGRFEHSIRIIPTPENVITEGMADMALNVLYSYEEATKIGLEELCPNPLDEDDPLFINKQWENAYLPVELMSNLAYLKYVNGWSDEKIIEYGLKFEFSPEGLIRKNLEYINNPIWAPYSFCYFYGKKLIEDKFGEHPSLENFKRLLTSPLLPSDLI